MAYRLVYEMRIVHVDARNNPVGEQKTVKGSVQIVNPLPKDGDIRKAMEGACADAMRQFRPMTPEMREPTFRGR